MFVHRTTQPVVVAAGDPGECLAHGVAHGVLPLLDGHVEVHEDEGAVGQELVLEELVGDEPHGEHHQEVELLAHEEPDGVRVVLVVQVLLCISNYTLLKIHRGVD